MENFNRTRLDREFELFSSRNFEKPRRCQNVEQIKFYLEELSYMIRNWEIKDGYVPNAAYELLAQYNYELNKYIYADYRESFS